MKKIIYYALLSCSFILLLLFTNLVNITKDKEIFNSPDEAANYISSKEYALNGKMYLEEEYLNKDFGNYLHPRGFITYNNKTVPFNFLGVPLFYGTFYTFLGDNIKWISILFLIIIIITLKNIYELYYKKEKNNLIFIAIFSLFCLPLIYYFNFVYLSIVPSITYFLLFIYYFLKFNKTDNQTDIYFGLFFGLIDIWFRYNDLLFIAFFIILNIYYNRIQYLKISKKFIKIGLFLFLSFIILLIPLLILNNEIYGNPFKYGPSIFNEIFFLEERATNLSDQVISIIFPAREIDLYSFFMNLVTTLLLLSPIFYIVGYLVLIKNKIFIKIGLYWLLIIYIIIYLGTSTNTYLSGIDQISLTKSVIRYWLIIHIGFIYLFLIFIKTKYFNKYIKIFLLFVLLILSLSSLNYELESAKQSLNYCDVLLNNISPLLNSEDYIISPIYDKCFFQNYNTITWWAVTVVQGKYFDKIKMADTIKFLISQNKHIFAYTDYYFNDESISLLKGEGINFELTEVNNLYMVNLKNETAD